MITPDLRPLRTEPVAMHVAQFYDDGAFPVQSIADFLLRGLLVDESAVIIATPEHFASIRTRRRTHPLIHRTAGRMKRLKMVEILAAK